MPNLGFVHETIAPTLLDGRVHLDQSIAGLVLGFSRHSPQHAGIRLASSSWGSRTNDERLPRLAVVYSGVVNRVT